MTDYAKIAGNYRVTVKPLLASCLIALLGGCAMAAVEGLALRGAAMGAAESLALRGAAAAAGRGAAGVGTRTIASRMVVSDPLLGMASRRGVLQEALYQLTSGGTRPAMLAVERNGAIRAGAQRLGMLDGSTGQIFSEGRVHGLLADGYLYEVRNGATGAAIGELRGFISSRSVQFPTRGLGSSSAFQRNMMVKVIRVQDGKYLIRLMDGAEEWLGPELVTLLIIGIGGSSDSCIADEGVLVRGDGEGIPFQQCVRRGGILHLTTADGLVLVDPVDVHEIIPGAINGEVRQTAVELADGNTIYGLVERHGDTFWIYDEGGSLVIADASAVYGEPTALYPS